MAEFKTCDNYAAIIFDTWKKLADRDADLFGKSILEVVRPALPQFTPESIMYLITISDIKLHCNIRQFMEMVDYKFTQADVDKVGKS